MKNIFVFWTALVFSGIAAMPCAAEKESKPSVAVTTSHSMLPLLYKATAGYLTLRDNKGESTANIFYVAYEKRGQTTGTRPITFAFNGGPGSSSVWLHLGALGPKRVDLHDDGTPPAPPARLVANKDTWLSFTDLVFIDPVGTGYSRPEDAKKEKQFFNLKADIESVGDFIRLYLTQAERWASPVYLCGESYGATRAVGMLEYIHAKHGITPSGIVLISPVLDFATIGYQQSNDLALMLALPSYAATAWYHKKSAVAMQRDVLDAAEQFSLGSYLSALAKGRALTPPEKDAAAGELARLAGISKDYALHNNLRIEPWRFRKELLRGSGRCIGRMDGRMVMPDTDGAGDSAGPDPALDRLRGPFAAAINDYLRRELKLSEEQPYCYLNPEVIQAWSWRTGIEGRQGYVDASQNLTDALHRNPNLRVFIAAGLYDLTTPYFATMYTLNHLDLDESRADTIMLHTYPAGHMMYTDRAVLKQLSRDVAAFYGKAP